MARKTISNATAANPDFEAKFWQAVLERFFAMISPLHQRIADNLRESHTLAALRYTLLPKLLSGEVFIKDSEKFLGSAYEESEI